VNLRWRKETAKRVLHLFVPAHGERREKDEKGDRFRPAIACALTKRERKKEGGWEKKGGGSPYFPLFLGFKEGKLRGGGGG